MKQLSGTILSLREYCRGLLADRIVNHTEAVSLKARLDELPALSSVPILAQIWSALLDALDDQHISDQESDELVALLGEFCDADPDALASTATKADPADHAPVYLQNVVQGQKYSITYTGADGKPSARDIIVRQIRHKDGAHYIACICLKASAPRTLRADRVGSMVNVDTGEVIL